MSHCPPSIPLQREEKVCPEPDRRDAVCQPYISSSSTSRRTPVPSRTTVIQGKCKEPGVSAGEFEGYPLISNNIRGRMGGKNQVRLTDEPLTPFAKSKVGLLTPVGAQGEWATNIHSPQDTSCTMY